MVTPTALTIAGSDSGGGAGIQADLKTFSALGADGASAITAITAQNTRAVTAVQEVPDDLVAAQIDAVLHDMTVHAVGVGMLLTASITRTVAARLLAGPATRDLDAMHDQGWRLARPGGGAVLMKGGHGTGPTCTDLLVSAEGEPVRLEAPRLPTGNTHGTGRSLSSATAAELAKGQRPEDAVRAAHAWLQGAIRGADRIGSGQGSAHRFHARWSHG